MKCNQSGPGFELESPCPFSTTITITPRAPYYYYYYYYYYCTVSLPSWQSVRRWSRRPEFNPRSRHTKDFKNVTWYLLLNTQQCKVHIKGKVEQSRKGVSPFSTSWCSSYLKDSFPVALDNGCLLYSRGPRQRSPTLLLLWKCLYPVDFAVHTNDKRKLNEKSIALLYTLV